MSRLIPRSLSACIALMLFPALVLGQNAAQLSYPSKPITLVVPLASGASTDTEFRQFLPRLQESMKQSFVFDFRPGAATTIGTAFVAKSAPDGYTLLLTNGGITIHPNFYADLPYEVPRSFEPVTQVTERYTILMISTVALPNVHTVPDLVAHGKANPGQLNCGTAGAGGITHIVCALVSSTLGIAITPVHYKGVSQGQIDLIAGRNHLSAGTIFVAQPAIKAGKLRPIAALNSVRSKIYPELKTALEMGIDIDYPTWLGVFAPTGTPAAIVNRLSSEIGAAARAPEVVSKLDAQGTYIVASTPEVFRKKVLSEIVRWRKVIQEKNIKSEE